MIEDCLRIKKGSSGQIPFLSQLRPEVAQQLQTALEVRACGEFKVGKRSGDFISVARKG